LAFGELPPVHTQRAPGQARNGAQIRPVTLNRYDTLGNLVEVKASYTTHTHRPEQYR
jgi:hypothetical protein